MMPVVDPLGASIIGPGAEEKKAGEDAGINPMEALLQANLAKIMQADQERALMRRATDITPANKNKKAQHKLNTAAMPIRRGETLYTRKKTNDDDEDHTAVFKFGGGDEKSFSDEDDLPVAE